MNDFTDDKISVIVPVYNVEEYIDKCLKSIVNQTYKNLEILLINDGSTDNSGSICDKWAKFDSRIKVLHCENKGVSTARNRGINIATGKFIAFCDPDDTLDNNFYEQLYKNIIKNNADVSMTSTKLYFDENYFGILQPYFTKVCDTFSEKFSLLRGGGANDKLYKLSLLKENNINFPDGRNWEGNLFLLKVIYYSNKMSFCPDTFYHYFVRKRDSITQTTDTSYIKKNMDDRCYILEEMCKFANQKSFSKKEKYLMSKYIDFSVFDKDDIYEHHMDLILKYMWKFMLRKYGFSWCLKKYRHTLRNKKQKR